MSRRHLRTDRPRGRRPHFLAARARWKASRPRGSFIAWSGLRRIIRGIDRLLRHGQGVVEFSSRPDCLLRIAFGHVDAPTRLADGTELEPGAAIVVLHLWNEHIPRMPAAGPILAWVSLLRRRMAASLDELAAYAETAAAMRDVRAIRARVAFADRRRSAKMLRIAAHFGFEPATPRIPLPVSVHIHDFFDNFWLLGLVWTFNPRSLRRRPLMRRRHELWMSKAALVKRRAVQSNAVSPGG